MDPPPTPPAAAAAIQAGASGEAGAAPWTFPAFVGCRRRLTPDDALFEAGNIEREQLARQAAVVVVRNERLQLSREAELACDAELADRLSVAFQCGQCHASLPTARLLELHVAEMHDSFFAAQAARRMPVYQCLVEGCPRRFCTVEERKQHLADHHQFPRHFHFDRMHLRRRKAQIRPLPRYRKAHGAQAIAADAEPTAGTGQEGHQAGTEGGAAATSAQPQDVVHGMSRLSMAVQTSADPAVIHFGRGRGRGLVSRPGGCGGRAARGQGPNQ